MREKNYKADGSHEVNMTPLIDVSLVLVVILLLATPLAFESSIAVKQAAASGKQAQEESKIERVELDIVSNEEVRVNRETIARADLEATLRPMLAKSAEHLVVVTCADQVGHGIFVQVLDTAKMCGAMQIAVKE